MPIFPQLPHNLGGYTLSRYLAVEEGAELYEATQARVERSVILRILPPGSDRECESAFLKRARLCAATEGLPNTARVVESLRADGIWFLAQERPSGYSLADLKALGHVLTAFQACRIIETVAEVYTLYESSGLHGGVLSPGSIYLNAQNNICLLSPLTGTEADDTAIRRSLADCIYPMRPIGVDGEHRILTLLQWLTDGYEDGSPVEWSTFREACAAVRQQLQGNTPAQPILPPCLKEARSRRRKKRTIRTILRTVGISVAALLFIGGTAAVGLLFPRGKQQILPAAHGGFLTVKRHGILQRIMLTPVSVTDYEQFLLALQSMPEARQKEINRDIPEAYQNHVPDEWEQLLSTARRQSPSRCSPMVQVNYWDALAYSRFIGGGATLPDAAQLQVVQANGGTSGLQEWSATATGETPLHLYSENAPLLIEMAEGGRPIPADSAAMRSPNTGFRLVFPSP